MIQSNQKQSLLVPYQLPKFISEDPNYANFVLFMQAYYEWMEQQGNTLDFSKSLLSYMDVDSTTQQFLDYYLNDFMSYFPKEILADQTKVLKIAKQLYQSKGTPASYQFLFRTLYNSDVELFYTKDAVLKASAGQWYVSKSLKLATSDPNFLQIQNLRLFGEQSQSFATVEAAIFDGLKTEVFISNIERLFLSGETVRVVDTNNQTVYFLNEQIVPVGTPGCESLRATIVGQISQLVINPKFRGLNYNVKDPVVIYGGLNPNTAAPLGAIAEIGAVTSGGVSGVTVVKEGYGYTESLYAPLIGAANTTINFINLNSGAQAPLAVVGGLDPSGLQNVAFIPVDSIQLKLNHYIGNTAFSSGPRQQNTMTGLWTNGTYQFANSMSANANTTLANAFTFTAFSTYPISSVLVNNQGGGITTTPTVIATSYYNSDNPIGTGGVSGVTQYSQADLSALGILAPIEILNAGSGYSNGTTIFFSGGTGRGAYANIKVNSAGSIINVNYKLSGTGINPYPLGGTGYSQGIPDVWANTIGTGTITASNTSNIVTSSISGNLVAQFSPGAYVVTSNNLILGFVNYVVDPQTMYLTANSNFNVTSNNFYRGTALLRVPGILGSGTNMSVVPNRIGEIVSFNILDNGQDYIQAPKVSLKVQDLLVKNIVSATIPTTGDIVYQGANQNTATYLATVDSIFPVENRLPTTETIYQMRVYNYTSRPVQNTNGVIIPLKIDGKGTAMVLSPGYNDFTNENITFALDNPNFDAANATITYGDGTAKANATFLNGLVIGQGQYLTDAGQPSSYDVLQSTIYNNYTYELTVEKEIAKYRDTLLDLLHPTGMQVIGRFKMKSANSVNFTTTDELFQAHTLAYYTNYTSSNATLKGSFANPSNNIIKFDALQGWNIANAITTNTTLTMTTANGDVISSEVTRVDYANNQVYLKDNTWVAIANVAYANSVAGSNSTINIQYLTYSYNIVNGGIYSNTANPLIDIIRPGDTIKINGVSQMVDTVNYANGVVYLQGNLSSGANGLVSVLKTFVSTNVQIYGPVGIENYPYLITTTGDYLTTEDGTFILLG